MAEAQTEIKITARDEASQVFSRIETGLGGMSSKLVAVGAALGAAAGVAAGARWLTDITSQSIQAADRLGELAQQTGVAGSVLSQYSLIAKTSGTDVEGLATGLNKLNLRIDDAANGGREAAATFARLGVDIRDTGGNLRSTDEIMLDVAERFSDMEDGAGKTAAAVDLFGKAGANLIPFLNQGKEGLREAAEVADKLGIKLKDSTIAAADQTADSFALVGSMATGLGNKIMAEVLPTVLDLTEKFKKFVIETGALDVAARAVGVAFKSLVSAGQVVAGVFEFIYNNVSTVAKSLVLVAKGEFSQAWDTMKTGVTNAGDIVKSTALSISDTWTKTTDSIVRADERNRNGKGGLGNATAKVGDEAKKAAQAFLDYVRASEQKLRVAEAELESGRKLTEIEKEREEFLAKLQAGVIKATEAEKAAALALFDKRAEVAENIRADEEYRKAVEETSKQLDKRLETEEKAIDVLRSAIEKQEEENLKIGMTKDQLAALEIQKLRDVQATKLRDIAIKATIPGLEAEVQALEEQVGLYDDLIARKEDGRNAAAMQDAADQAKKAAEESAKEWAKTADGISNSLTDALLRGFESGKGFAQNLAETAQNLFKSLVLKPVIQAVVSPIAAGVTSMFGFSGSAAAETIGGGGGGGGFSSLLSIGSSLGSLGSFASTGFMNTIAGTGMIEGLSAAGALLEGGSIMGGIGMGLGAIAPYALAAIAIMSLLDGGGGPKTGGIYASSSSALSGLKAGGVRWNDPYADSSRIEEDNRTATMSFGIMSQYGALAALFGGRAAALDFGMQWSTDPAGDAQSDITGLAGSQVFRNMNIARDDEALQAAFSEMSSRMIVAALQQTTLDQAFTDYFAGLDVATASAAQLEQALQTATAVRNMTESIRDLGGVFGTFSGITVDARENIAALTGGFDAFVQKTQQYVQNYYSEAEQAGITAAQVLRSLGAVGLDVGSIDDKGDVRSLLDSLSGTLDTTTGQEQFAALLNASASIASIAPYLEEAGLNLAQAAALSPGGGAYAVLAASSDAASTTADNTAAMSLNLQSLIDQNAAAYSEMIELLRDISNGIGRIETAGDLAAAAPGELYIG